MSGTTGTLYTQWKRHNMEDTTLVVNVTVKANRLTEMRQPTPQQLIEVELSAARRAMDSFYTETHTIEESTLEPLHEEESKSQDSIEPVKRANPQVGRAIGPKRKSDTKITQVTEGE